MGDHALHKSSRLIKFSVLQKRILEDKMKFPIAIQLYSVRDDMGEDFKGTLKKVKEMGYDGVEFAGLYDHSAEEVKALCDEIGLVPVSAHVSYYEMLEEGTLETYAAIGCKFIAIPWLDEDPRPGGKNYPKFVEDVKKIGAKAKALGMQLCYHNHDFEFQKVNGKYILDTIYADIPADLLQTQLDTCWVNVGGEDPVKYVKKYAGRADIIHLKDFAGKKSDNMYALIGIDDGEKKDTDGQFEYRPLGRGLQNIPAILEAAEEAGTKWVVFEQDEPSMGLTPLECAKVSIDYLRSL